MIQNKPFLIYDFYTSAVLKHLSVFEWVFEGMITKTSGWKLKKKMSSNVVLTNRNWCFSEIIRNWGSFSVSTASSSLSPWVSHCKPPLAVQIPCWQMAIKGAHHCCAFSNPPMSCCLKACRLCVVVIVLSLSSFPLLLSWQTFSGRVSQTLLTD